MVSSHLLTCDGDEHSLDPCGPVKSVCREKELARAICGDVYIPELKTAITSGYGWHGLHESLTETVLLILSVRKAF